MKSFRLAEMRARLMADKNAAIADAHKRSAPACASRDVDADGVGAIDGLCGRSADHCSCVLVVRPSGMNEMNTARAVAKRALSHRAKQVLAHGLRPLDLAREPVRFLDVA